MKIHVEKIIKTAEVKLKSISSLSGLFCHCLDYSANHNKVHKLVIPLI